MNCEISGRFQRLGFFQGRVLGPQAAQDVLFGAHQLFADGAFLFQAAFQFVELVGEWADLEQELVLLLLEGVFERGLFFRELGFLA